MRGRLAIPPTARRALEVARSSRVDATRLLGELSLEAQLALVCETPVARRAELIALAPDPEALVPLLPEAELCFTVKAVGLADAGWLLEIASPEQVVACLDLDAWKGDVPDRAGLDAWLEALTESSPESLLPVLHALDPELVVSFLKGRIAAVAKPPDADGWDPPDGSQTLEGQFWFCALGEDDDLAPVLAVLRTLFELDYWTYFRMMQGVIWELDAENEEWARRWRSGRLEDLGFPTWEEAMRIYATLAPGRLGELPPGAAPLAASAWHLPVWMPQLPGPAASGPSIFRAIAELDAEERRAAFYAFVALANRLAVADGLPLADAESIPRALDKAARLASLGLEHLVRERGLSPVEILRRAEMERLFRVGANLDPGAARPAR